MIDQVISGYHLISMRSHQHIDLINTQNNLFLPLLFCCFVLFLFLFFYIFSKITSFMPISVIVSKLRGWLKQNDYLSETISTYDLSRHSLETGPHHKSKPLVKSSIFVSPPL